MTSEILFDVITGPVFRLLPIRRSDGCKMTQYVIEMILCNVWTCNDKFVTCVTSTVWEFTSWMFMYTLNLVISHTSHLIHVWTLLIHLDTPWLSSHKTYEWNSGVKMVSDMKKMPKMSDNVIRHTYVMHVTLNSYSLHTRTYWPFSRTPSVITVISVVYSYNCHSLFALYVKWNLFRMTVKTGHSLALTFMKHIRSSRL